ncbi:MAG: BirA family biotin operon repressor/biotin-[acetyl-CoA-carboxylase] ligase [Planctomycetota bacterium]|uniref:biotin--[acetyl-CoA-carboxylase] ligase n=1 Tax=Patiriisocius sp. Uisw_047 TaxID=3230969 RepID=UPI0039EA53D7
MNIIKLSATDSTNSYLAALAKNTALKDETIVVTDHQKKGRGQRESVWQSQPTRSLTFSVFKRIEGVSVQQQFAISMLVAVALADYLQTISGTAITVKWPNDIMAAGKKCGGILIENQVRGTAIKSTIVGVGLNINEEVLINLPQATSLRLVSGKTYDLDIILKGVTSEMFSALTTVSQEATASIQFRFEQFLFKKGVQSRYRLSDGTEFLGTITGVNLLGQLLMDLPQGNSLKFWNKEVEMLY